MYWINSAALFEAQKANVAGNQSHFDNDVPESVSFFKSFGKLKCGFRERLDINETVRSSVLSTEKCIFKLCLRILAQRSASNSCVNCMVRQKMLFEIMFCKVSKCSNRF